VMVWLGLSKIQSPSIAVSHSKASCEVSFGARSGLLLHVSLIMLRNLKALLLKCKGTIMH
jgi:hypothetical protein